MSAMNLDLYGDAFGDPAHARRRRRSPSSVCSWDGEDSDAGPVDRSRGRATKRARVDAEPVRDTVVLDDDDDESEDSVLGPRSKPIPIETTTIMPARKKATDQPVPRKTQPVRKRKTADAPTTPISKKGKANDGNATKKAPATGKGSRKKPESIAESMPIPKTIEEMGEADQMIWSERKKGKSWTEIATQWATITGQKPAATTLPNRLTRIRENIGDFNDTDDRLMVRCKREIDDTYSREVWAMVAEQMVYKGGAKYTALSVEKRYKELMAQEMKDDEEGDAMDEDGDGEAEDAGIEIDPEVE